MARNDTVQLLTMGGKGHTKWLSPDEAFLLLGEKHWDGSKKYAIYEQRVHGKGRREWLEPTPEPAKPGSNKTSPCALTAAEMKANVGLSDVVIHCAGDEQANAISPEYQAVVREKVRLFNPAIWRQHLIKCAKVQESCPV